MELVSKFTVENRDLNSLHARAFGEIPKEIDWAQRLADHALTWIGAFDSEALIGFVQVIWDGGAHAFLLDTVVDPEWQHHGIGTALVKQAALEAKTGGCEWLHVDFEAELANFYLAECGFQSTTAGLLNLSTKVPG